MRKEILVNLLCAFISVALATIIFFGAIGINNLIEHIATEHYLPKERDEYDEDDIHYYTNPDGTIGSYSQYDIDVMEYNNYLKKINNW